MDESSFLWGVSSTDASIDLVTEIYGLGSSILRKHRQSGEKLTKFLPQSYSAGGNFVCKQALSYGSLVWAVKRLNDPDDQQRRYSKSDRDNTATALAAMWVTIIK